jgi:hypothetical protein
MRIQQLEYDEEKNHLFCPDHPNVDLVVKVAEAHDGAESKFIMMCTAAVEGPAGQTRTPILNCMNSAEWPSQADMMRDLPGLRHKSS